MRVFEGHAMTREQAIRTLTEGGSVVDLADAISIVIDDTASSSEEIMLGLSHRGFVQEQAAIGLYRRLGTPLPTNRNEVVTDPAIWRRQFREPQNDRNARVGNEERDWASDEGRPIQVLPQPSLGVSLESYKQSVQFSVFMTHSPGRLSQVFRELARAKVNITNIAMMDSAEHGLLRIMVDDPSSARTVFAELDIPVTETEVLSVALPNRFGAAAELCNRLASAHINIGYMYCTGGVSDGNTLVVLKVPDIKKAQKVLETTQEPVAASRIKLRRQTRSTKR